MMRSRAWEERYLLQWLFWITPIRLIINCMHGANGCFLYVKDVEAGATDVQLGTEEKGALERALGYVKD